MMRQSAVRAWDESEADVEQAREIPEPCTMILFGASGDLSGRKLVPALFRLFQEGLLPAEFTLVGTSLVPMGHEAFRSRMRTAVEQALGAGGVDPAAWNAFARGLYYVPVDISSAGDYARLGGLLERVEAERRTRGNRLFYLAVSPALFGDVVERLGESGLARSDARRWSRIVVEKPFGTDLPSARRLNTRLRQHFDESRIYRMDHYLGKEMVQNLLVLRLANGIFEPLWNRQHIDHVQVTCAEPLGVEGRGGYYEQAGVVRDMIQNHAFQVLSLIAMEPPASLEPEAVRDEKVRVLESARPFTPERIRAECVRGQYGPGLIAGAPVCGYRQEPGVSPTSGVETYAMLTMRFDNPRWAGVPFYVRSGKRMKERLTEVVVQFKEGRENLFGAGQRERMSANQLIIRIQPHESVTLRVAMKAPGRAVRVRDMDMSCFYAASHEGPPPEAYERLLLDGMLGVSTLYTREDMVERAWELVTPVLDAWSHTGAEPNYAAGSWGPADASRLLERHGHAWNGA
ncbi:glucose-6-phosphate dehydrogenase [Archangium sp. Cb G35]|uniref:glucose-6-phosphate dehydrogenase n=1 Tax=Archangium sp. Cb G35 TaxID=1920190 RepID=UPI000A7455B0|nr:glucose-6-phosphate dehydrogenase [Archangium sp. Cb G35]